VRRAFAGSAETRYGRLHAHETTGVYGLSHTLDRDKHQGRALMPDPDLTHDPPAGEARQEEDMPPGIFHSWNSLYATVIAYAFLLILILYLLSVSLDYSGS
jgi:hypothetical protein